MKKPIPGLLWVSIAVLGMMALWTLLGGLKVYSALARLSAGASEDLLLEGFRNRLALGLLGTALMVVLLVGLLLGQKWAYILTLVFSALSIVLAFGQGALNGAITMVGNAIVVIPMLACTRFFFPSEIQKV